MLYHQHYPNTTSDRKTIIVLHGLFGSSQNWRQICSQLSEHWEVYAVDLRNHGKSPHLDSMSYADMANDVIVFMDEHNIKHADLLGHSMGGKVAMQATLTYPERFSSLIIADIAPVQYPPRHTEVFAAIDKINHEKPISRKAADELVKTILPDTGVRLFLLTNLNRADANGVEWKINMEGIKNNYIEISTAPQAVLNKAIFDKPTLVIKGSLSPYIQDEHHELFLQHFPAVEFTEIHKAGHWLHAEKPQEFLDLVNKFLSQ